MSFVRVMGGRISVRRLALVMACDHRGERQDVRDERCQQMDTKAAHRAMAFFREDTHMTSPGALLKGSSTP